MEILKPVPIGEIPNIGRSGPRVHEELYQKALALNGSALPVQFDNAKKAKYFNALFYNPRSRGRQLGLKSSLRRTVVFVYRADSV